MSIAYLDPGNIESDLQQGTVAQYRVGLFLNFLSLSISQAKFPKANSDLSSINETTLVYTHVSTKLLLAGAELISVIFSHEST